MLTANGFARNPHHRTKCESHRGVALVCGRLTLLLSLSLLLHWHFAKLDATAFLGCVTHARRLAECVAVAACSLALPPSSVPQASMFKLIRRVRLEAGEVEQ